MNEESKTELLNRFIDWFTPNPLFRDDLKLSAEEFLEHEKLSEPEYPDTISITWCVEDLESQAQDIEESEYEDDPKPIYDRTKFVYALSAMKSEYDCNYGITWDTVTTYLDQYCKLNEEEE